MRRVERWTTAWFVLLIAGYGVIWAVVERIKLEPRPSQAMQAFVREHFDALCAGKDAFPTRRDADGVYSCAYHIRQNILLSALWLPFPVAIGLTTLLFVFVHLGLGALIIRASSPLCATVRKGLEVVKLEPELLSLPAAASFAVAALLWWTFWRAFSDPRAVTISQDQMSSLAWTIILAPPVIAGYFATAFALLLTNAALIHAYLAHAAGRKTGFWRSVLAAARVAPAVAVLSVAVFGFLLGLALAVHGVRRRVSWGTGEAARFSAFFIESGLLIGCQLVVAAMLSESLSLRAALFRVSGVIKPAGREILTAAFGMATMRHDACIAAMVGPMMTGWFMAPFFFTHDSIAPWMSFTLAAGVLGGALYYSFLGALEGVFAAGIWVYAAEGKVLKGLERGEIAAFLGDLEDLKAGG